MINKITISCVMAKKTTSDGRTFMGVSSKGQYLGEYQAAEGNNPETLTSLIKGVSISDLETRFLVKITQKSAVALPTEEGVYTITFNGEGWKDDRPEVKRPTIRLSGTDFVFTKTHDLKHDLPNADK